MPLHITKKQIKNSYLVRLWRRGLWQKIYLSLLIVVILLLGSMYSVAQWYIHSEASTPLQMGVSFIPDYAQSLGVNPEQTMDGLLSIGVKQFRLVSYWSDIEKTQGNYDFSQLDWQFKKAESAHAKIILTVGLRQPRWPECHAPSWVNMSGNESEWKPQLMKYIDAVVERYRNSPSLEKYQLENEYFLHGFGNCTNYDRDRLINEYSAVKQLDPAHPIIIGRSNNAIGFPSGSPTPDEYGISIYKRVWDAAITHRYIEYPYPAWFYGYIAGVQKITQNRDMIVSEMQAEAWAPNNKTITQISLDEQNKSINAARLKDRFTYAKATGMRQIEMWGAEYWYYRLTVLHDPSLWLVAQKEYSNQQ